MSFLVSLEQDAESTVLAAAKAELLKIEGIVITDVQDDIIPAFIQFITNAATTTVSKLGSFLSGLVSDITGSSTGASTTVTDTSSPTNAS